MQVLQALQADCNALTSFSERYVMTAIKCMRPFRMLFPWLSEILLELLHNMSSRELASPARQKLTQCCLNAGIRPCGMIRKQARNAHGDECHADAVRAVE